jgi:hypothetical protein
MPGPTLADVDAIKRFEANVGLLVLANDNRPKVDMEDLGWLAVGDMSADDTHIAQRGAFRRATDALQQIQDRFRTPIGNDVMINADLAKQVEKLTLVFLHLNTYCRVRHPESGSDLSSDRRGRVTFDREVQSGIQHDPPIETDRAIARTIRLAFDV